MHLWGKQTVGVQTTPSGVVIQMKCRLVWLHILQSLAGPRMTWICATVALVATALHLAGTCNTIENVDGACGVSRDHIMPNELSL